MARRPTIADLAEKSGVSVATVDRVLNGRLPVRTETARRVYDAATEIGFHAAGLIRQQIEKGLPHVRLGFLLQRREQFFYQAFAEALSRAAQHSQGFRCTAQIDYLADQTPATVSAKLQEMGARCQAVAMVAVDHPQISAAVAELQGRGVPVVALLSDFAPGMRAGYIGINNRKAGRSAGWVIARTAEQPGKVAVFVGSHRFHGQEMREIGLRSYFREHAPGFEVLESYVNLEESRIAYEATLDLLQRHRDLAGLYVAGGGMEGVIAALRDESAAGRLVAVCNEITPESRMALADNVIAMVIATPLDRLCAEVVSQLGQAVLEQKTGIAGQTFIPFDLHISETI